MIKRRYIKNRFKWLNFDVVAALRLRDNSRYRIYKGQLLRVSVVRALTQRRYVRTATDARATASIDICMSYLLLVVISPWLRSLTPTSTYAPRLSHINNRPIQVHIRSGLSKS